MEITKCTSGQHPARLAKVTRFCSSTSSSFLEGCSQESFNPRRIRRKVWVRSTRLGCRSMVNVEVWSPSVLLGVGLIGSGVALFGVRQQNPKVSRDSDVVISSLITVTGGALIFQGWRLDPLLLLCQVMTCSVACWFALESLNLRSEVSGTEANPPVFEDAQRPANRQQDNSTNWYTDFSPQDYNQGSGLPPPGEPFNDWNTVFQEENASVGGLYQNEGETSGGEQGIVGASGDMYFGDRGSNAIQRNVGGDSLVEPDRGNDASRSSGESSTLGNLVESVEDWE